MMQESAEVRFCSLRYGGASKAAHSYPITMIVALISIIVASMIPGINKAQAAGANGQFALNIRHDMGGNMIDYAIRAKELSQSGKSVNFRGSCDSACTLYLTLPTSLTCVAKGASFGFHLPYGTSPSANRQAAQYLLKQYPGWVRSWISAKGGLTNSIKRMNYGYASRFLRNCDGRAAKTVKSQVIKSKSGKVSNLKTLAARSGFGRQGALQ